MELGPGVNVLLGKNAQGKTNVLEAISCLSLTKSFYAATDATLVQLGEKGFEIEGRLCNDTGIELSVNLTYGSESAEKEFMINGVKVERLTHVVGMFPVVILSPENSAITFGGPADRRRFLDLLLSQLSRSYFDHLLEYRHILRQRNRILAESKQRGNIRGDVLEPWNQGLAEYGARIVHKRAHFVEEFGEYVLRSYSDLVEGKEVPLVRYTTEPEIASDESIEQIAGNILDRLRARESEECRRGVSLVGPHRDDLVFYLNGIELQKYASQGQHKTFLIALKIAEFFYLKEKKDEKPILLLDDVLGELDGSRSRRLLSHIAELGQTIITTTDESPFDDVIQWGHEHRKFYVEQGTCRPINIGISKEAAISAS
jgi:DNA replication and repair protein RecF